MLAATTRISVLSPSRHKKGMKGFAVFEGPLLHGNFRILSFEIFENLALGFLRQNLFLVFNVILRSKPFSLSIVLISSRARVSGACPEFKSESSIFLGYSVTTSLFCVYTSTLIPCLLAHWLFLECSGLFVADLCRMPLRQRM